ncbi:hypothetical protein RF11_10435 [Thelohanellus kitauei]|uniref:Uncharacterized protein n=1 Tax=Thelohanellus kitauei TaxID=669202 RepID=A0A0C2NMB1_THEKT|nr:hypothetical protein RF11_10435 [Thelohanellus kitauei]
MDLSLNSLSAIVIVASPIIVLMLILVCYFVYLCLTRNSRLHSNLIRHQRGSNVSPNYVEYRIANDLLNRAFGLDKSPKYRKDIMNASPPKYELHSLDEPMKPLS